MTAQPMKHCTIIYDGPPLQACFRPASQAALRHFAGACLDNMMEEVERIAGRLGLADDIVVWTGTAAEPLRLGVICEDRLADLLRIRLSDHLIVELDAPRPSL